MAARTNHENNDPELAKQAEVKAHRLFVLKLTLLVILSWFGLAATYVASYMANESVAKRWQSFNRDHLKKLQAIEEFNVSVGYGGMIHCLKNYILRGDESYLDRFDAAVVTARASLAYYRGSASLQRSEIQALEVLNDLLDSYTAAADRVREKSLPPSAADRLAKVDDTEYLAAKDSLQIILNAELSAAESEFEKNLGTARQRVFAVAGLSAFLSFSLGIYWAYQVHSIASAIASSAESRADEHEKLRRKAEEASQAKTTFLANMSHEIRTPMTAILGYADLLAGDFANDPEQSAAAVCTVRSNAQHLLAIIDDILDVSKLEAGRFQLEVTEAPLIQIVQEVASLSKPYATKKDIDLRVCYDTPVPMVIQSDPTRLRQILLNLVSNAIKFTDNGGVTIRLAFDLTSSHLSISVEDTGIGMTSEQREMIARFSAFRQADMSTTRRFGGTGLGLHISNTLMQMLGGILEVESVYGQGSTFKATMTIEHASDVQMWPTASPEPGNNALRVVRTETAASQSLEGVKILLAEDGVDNQRLICHYLRKAGADFAVCENGEQAIEHITVSSSNALPQIVLMDMQMPVIDGYEATRRLRCQGYTIPIIALTAHATENDRQKCLDAGCDEYISKPINRALLLSTCAAFIQKQQTSSSLV